MANSIPYFALILISLILIVVSWFKAKNKKVILLYLTIVGLIYSFEFIVLVLFKSYQYYPGIFKNSYFDNIFGANVSDGFIVPSIVVMIAVFDLGIGWMFFFILLFMGTEELFLHLGIYRHFWWHTMFTGISMPVAFVLGKRLWRVIRYKMGQAKNRWLILYFTDASIQSTLFFYLAAVFHLFFFRPGWFHEPERAHVAYTTIIILIESFFFSLGAALGKRWFWNGNLLLAITVVYSILFKTGILLVPGIWAMVLLILFHAAIAFLLLFFQKLIYTKTG